MSLQVKPSPGRLLAAIFVPLAVLAAAYYASKGQLGDLGGPPLRLTVRIDGPVALGPGPRTDLVATLTLENRTGDAIALRAADPCRVVRWVVQAPGETFVQSKGDACTPETDAATIDGASTVERREIVPLDTSRYKPGVTYTLVVQFWGQDASAEFETAP